MNYYENTEENLTLICLECKFYGTKDCIKSKCNIGFALNAIKASNPNSIQIITDGQKLIPKSDTKLYNKNLIAKGIASVCKICKECNKGHDDNCTISLARKSLERTYLSDDVDYPGSVLMYLFNVSKQDQDLADKIKSEYDSIVDQPKEEVVMDKSSIAKKHPILVDLKENQTYFWCTCGKSSNLPFCNGAHVGTNFSPLTFTSKKTEKTHLCACNHTKTPPFCDGSHLKLV
ncbi:CDGSH iron-sulfur domain-containing protein [uncultured Clostridium sp.]|uniref:CDGSH iron-sulfur domain-containing protein n=1 Tax=uncultured Clostridium sp. TaxID=59620 RepID=UPI002589837A|nr:CDGSH iron-sulfur domain-containing protein [uncultured Clostridium sp.]